MKITVIYGTMHKGSTYNCVQLFLEQIKNKTQTEVTEFFLPKDMPNFCVGCFSCILNSEETCPHYSLVHPIAEALEQADIIILASPVYVFDVSGQLKVLLDHFAYRWMIHRPHPSMFKKVGLVVSTSAGAGNKSTNKIMKTNLSFWGVKRIFSYGKAVQASGWDGVKPEKKAKITADINAMADKVYRTSKKADKLPPTFATRAWFTLVQTMSKGAGWNKADKDYWQEQGWAGGKKPWH